MELQNPKTPKPQNPEIRIYWRLLINQYISCQSALNFFSSVTNRADSGYCISYWSCFLALQSNYLSGLLNLQHFFTNLGHFQQWGESEASPYWVLVMMWHGCAISVDPALSFGALRSYHLLLQPLASRKSGSCAFFVSSNFSWFVNWSLYTLTHLGYAPLRDNT